ncbi:hypothetical protein Tco_0830841 [Tanacetum coccineum]
MELMEICTKLSDGVLALENVKTAQDLEITSLKKRVKKREKKKKARTPQLKRSALITTAGVSVSTAEPSTPPITTTVIKDEDLIIAQTLTKMRSEKSKEKAKERGSKENSSEPVTRPTRGVTMQEPSKSGTRKAVPPSQHDLKDKGKAKIIKLEKPLKKKDQIKFDEEVAKRLAEELEAELEEEERADYELAQRLQAEEQGELTIEESVKRQKLKLEDDAEKAELQLCLEIVPRDDEAVNVESLSTKYPIVDWKTYILGEDKMYYQIIRADGTWTMDVSANTIANCFRHCKLRSTDNMTFENSDEGGESTQELQNLIKELGYRNAMDVEDVLTHPEENVVAQLLTDEEIIESVIGINKDDIDEEDDESSTMEPPSRNEAIKAAITLNNFLLSYEKTTPEVLTMLRKIRDEIQGEIDFNKKQKTIESFFKKPS